jgi:hypothetical protein
MDQSSLFRTPHTAATLQSMDVAFSQQIADLRREIEGIQELNRIYRYQNFHTHQNQAAKERRKVRLEEIVKQLAALRSK